MGVRPTQVKTMAKTFVMAFCLTICALAAHAQQSFQEAIRELTNPDAGVRLRAVQALKPAASLEAAIPLSTAITDAEDSVQLEAIAAELNIFLAEKVVPRKRVGLIVEVRNKISAEAAFSGGPFALNLAPVPIAVVNAFRTAARDENARVAVEALYAFGAFAAELSGSARRELLRSSAPELAGMIGLPDPALRVAALRVIGRFFAPQPGDGPVDQGVGDAVIVVLNEKNGTIRDAAMDALSDMRYERSVQALTDIALYYGRRQIGLSALAALSRIGHPSSTPMFVQQLTSGNSTSRIIAIEGLARLGDRRQDEAIRSALAREPSEAVLLAQSFASALLVGGPLDPLFGALTKSRLRDQALRYLIELAPGRAASFTAPSRDLDPRRRADVADILALSRDKAALPIVEPLTQDSDPLVARSADRAVARLRRPS